MYSHLLNSCDSLNNNRVHDPEPAFSPKPHYIFKDMPADFQNNVEWKEHSRELTDKYINCIHTQEVSDQLYSEFCIHLTTEMNKFLKCSNVKRSGMNINRKNKPCKPYWNHYLTTLWKDFKTSERKFLKCHNNATRLLRNEFYIKRKIFTKELRKAERQFWQEQLNELENVCTGDPKKFWQNIKKLGPKKMVTIPEKVYIDNVLTGDINAVLQKWRDDFYNLYNAHAGFAQFETHFYDYVKGQFVSLEQQVDRFESNNMLNLPISMQEVQYMVNKLKRNKATGLDNIPYEMFMNQDVIKILFNLYSKCFASGVIPSDWHKAVITPIPKSGNKDPHVPTNCRAISLLSCVCKGYTNILNNRLMSRV